MTEAQQLLALLRMLNIRVRLEGDSIRCKPARGVLPNDLVPQIRALKSQLIELLETERQEVDWRVDAIGEPLVGAGAERTPGQCAFCGARMPAGQTGKCVLCCLAAVKCLETSGLAGQTTDPISPLSTMDSGSKRIQWDMSRDITEAA